MLISYNWLKEFISLTEPTEEVAKLLTDTGLEVEHITTYEQIPGMLAGVVLGEVLTCEQHPNADRLRITTVNVGEDEPLKIVCGAPNVAAGQKVAVATIGATLHLTSGDSLTIKKGKIRGEVSEGMICAEDELGTGISHEGILVLDTNKPNGTPIAEILGLKSDTIFEIGLTPNRGDAASHLGTARDLSAALNRDLNDWTSFPPAAQTNSPISIKIEDTSSCLRYSGLYIQNVKVAPSPNWLQLRLKSIGLEPVNNIVDATNYALHSLGQPLHAFDADKIAGSKIKVRKAQTKEYLVTLDNVKRSLQVNDLLICDKENPLVIAGVFGGIGSGVTDQTQNIFVESAYFAPAGIRKTSQHHNLKTDSSFRYERGTDPDMTLPALYFVAKLIQQIAGGMAAVVQDEYPETVQSVKVEVRYDRINRLIGHEIEPDVIKGILHRLDIKTEKNSLYGHIGFEESFTAIVPPYRSDVTREADIIEEILRVYGFNNIPLPSHLSTQFFASFPKINPAELRTRTARTLAASGFAEIMTNSLTTDKYTQKTNALDASKTVRLANPLSEELNVMRQSLLFTGLEVVAYNLNRQQKDLRLFEFGSTYHKQLPEADKIYADKIYKEEPKLALFVTGNVQAESWQAKSQKSDFHTLNASLQQLFALLSIDVNSNDLDQQATLSGLDYGLEYTAGRKKKTVARAGAVSSQVLKTMGIKQPVFYAEIDWQTLTALYNPGFSVPELSKYPEVRRDLSMILDKQVSFRDIKELALQTERKMLKEVNVFDVYEHESLGQNKKSYAVSFVLQDADKTLTDKVIDKAMNRLMSRLEKETGAVIRKQ